MRLILLGPPGAGKGTQAESIVKKYGVEHISTGDIFRSNIKKETELGKKVKSYLSQGELVPDELTIDLVWDRLDQEDVKEGFLLDGFPRTIPQAEALEKGLEERGLKLDHVINIDVDKDVLVKRLSGRRTCLNCGATYHVDVNPPKVEGVCDKCGGEVVQREDDKEETVKNRINVYEAQTAPLIDFYSERGLVFSVDGSLSISDVFKEIEKELG